MNYEELQSWLLALAEQGRFERDEVDDLLRQRRLFDENRSMIEEQYQQRVVGYVANELVFGDRITEVLDRARSTGRLVYFEPVGFRGL